MQERKLALHGKNLISAFIQSEHHFAVQRLLTCLLLVTLIKAEGGRRRLNESDAPVFQLLVKHAVNAASQM